jgi:hypothetical protein
MVAPYGSLKERDREIIAAIDGGEKPRSVSARFRLSYTRLRQIYRNRKKPVRKTWAQETVCEIIRLNTVLDEDHCQELTNLILETLAVGKKRTQKESGDEPR